MFERRRCGGGGCGKGVRKRLSHYNLDGLKMAVSVFYTPSMATLYIETLVCVWGPRGLKTMCVMWQLVRAYTYCRFCSKNHLDLYRMEGRVKGWLVATGGGPFERKRASTFELSVLNALILMW